MGVFSGLELSFYGTTAMIKQERKMAESYDDRL
jgi:hypothetical protein